MKEYYYDKLMNIHTQGSKMDINNSIVYHPYEPTPYSALEVLFKHYEVKMTDNIVDFGCGKGRLNFYINYSFNAVCTGIEMNETFFNQAIQNQNSYFRKFKKHKGSIQFLNCYAEDYVIQPKDNRFYFFNPFSVQIFIKVVNNILLSVEQSKREIDLILYYASDDYQHFLETNTLFNLYKEITLPGHYEKDSYERFLIYRLA